MRQMRLIFEEKEFKKLENSKEVAKIHKKATSWEDYILKLAKIRR